MKTKLLVLNAEVKSDNYRRVSVVLYEDKKLYNAWIHSSHVVLRTPGIVEVVNTDLQSQLRDRVFKIRKKHNLDFCYIEDTLSVHRYERNYV